VEEKKEDKTEISEEEKLEESVRCIGVELGIDIVVEASIIL
jgi:hypothetical protein